MKRVAVHITPMKQNDFDYYIKQTHKGLEAKGEWKMLKILALYGKSLCSSEVTMQSKRLYYKFQFVEFYTCIQKWIQLTSKFFFSREHVAIIVVMQFPPRLKWRRQISYSRQIEWWKLEKKEETFLPQNNFASGCIKILYLLSTEWCKPWSICKTKLSKLDLL